jgi:hypothetical protein
MNPSRSIIVSMLVALTFLFVCMAGCATQQPRDFHATVQVGAPTLLVTGPAKGHWAEQDEHQVMTYTVLGTECDFLAAQTTGPVYASHGDFLLGPGVSLCAIQLRSNQSVLLHAERP